MDELDVLLAELNNERLAPKITSATLVSPSAKDGTDEIDDILKGLEISATSAKNKAAVNKPAAPTSAKDVETILQAAPKNPVAEKQAAGVKETHHEVNMCAGCQKEVAAGDEGAFFALGQTWHTPCFACTKCRKGLTGEEVFDNKGRPYCAKDYNALFGARCAYCNGEIDGNCVNALGRMWHSDHFFCAQCGKGFDNGVFLEKNGKAYCEDDYYGLFAPRCAKCSKSVRDTVVSALNSQWHPECFVCTVCKANFTNQYFEHQGKPYCETHFHAAQGTMCQSCQKPITGRCVTAIGGKRYHVEHFTCAYCKKQLYNTTYKETGGKYFCQPCHVKLFE